MSKRTAAVFTGNRAEYGLLAPILKAIADHPVLDYRLIVTGSHLDDDFGKSSAEIEADGFRIAHRFKLDLFNNDLFSQTQAMGRCILRLSSIFQKKPPDFLLLYGDRFETFAAAVAGTQMGIPTAHIEGGDYTDGGAFDDSLRHAITKLAHLHFTTNEASAERVRKLGEEEWRIHNVGLPALDLIKQKKFAPPEEVIERFNLNLEKPVVIFTQHPVATEADLAVRQIEPSLEALKRAAVRWDAQILITYPNHDPGGRKMLKRLQDFASNGVPNVQLHGSLGRHFYHGVLNIASACVGNSSSGIKETPAFGCPTVNIGSRQRGRLRAENVLDADYDADQITAALERCLFDETFIHQARRCSNPYGGGDAGKKVAEVLATTEINPHLIQKKMTY
jgi:UDP-N-acetylglucosamine 2-epimerase (non-hydrolysing)/GDP/UDP-N,N'-diacetylbacillosamine 2-epimerase (hydrolysing)